MAQLVEHHLAKVGVAGSNPVVRSKQYAGESMYCLRRSFDSSGLGAWNCTSLCRCSVGRPQGTYCANGGISLSVWVLNITSAPGLFAKRRTRRRSFNGVRYGGQVDTLTNFLQPCIDCGQLTRGRDRCDRHHVARGRIRRSVADLFGERDDGLCWSCGGATATRMTCRICGRCT